MEPRLRLNIDQLLKQKSLRASDLSKLTGIPKQTISEWRSGLVPKSVVALKRVAAALGVSLDELIFHSQRQEESVQFKPTKQLGSEISSPKQRLIEAEPFWFSFDQDCFLNDVSPAFLLKMDYGLTLMRDRPLSEFVVADDWPAFQSAYRGLSDTSSRSFDLRFLSRDHRILGLRCQEVTLHAGEAYLVYALDKPDSAVVLDVPENCASEQLIQSVLQTYTSESWQPTIQYELRYEGTSLPWLSTRRLSFAQSLLATLHNLAGFAAKSGQPICASRDIRAEHIEHSLMLRIESPCSPIPAHILDIPRAFSSDLGARWTIQDSELQGSIITCEIPLNLNLM